MSCPENGACRLQALCNRYGIEESGITGSRIHIEEKLPADQCRNYVRRIYDPFTDEEISAKIVQLLRTPDVKAEVEIVYQSLDGLHKACPDHPGDWYFSGDYPTPGGYKLLNRAYIDYYENEYL